MKYNPDPALRISELISEHSPEYIVLDCDGTLYPDIMKAREVFYETLYAFLLKKYGFETEHAKDFIRIQKEKFNTVSEIAACLLSGVDEEEFNREVIAPMDLDMLGIGESSPWKVLSQYDIPLIIFTNNSSYFASRIASRVGVVNCVKRIFGESELGFVRKPSAEVFEVVSRSLPQASRVLFFDDDTACIEMGKGFGWKSVHTFFERKNGSLGNDEFNLIMK